LQIPMIPFLLIFASFAIVYIKDTLVVSSIKQENLK